MRKGRTDMKRHVVIGILLAVLICLFCLLNGDIVDSTDYTGTWYRSSDGAQYIFENGILWTSTGG